MSSTSRHQLILVVAIAALLGGCETSKPEGGLTRTSATKSAAGDSATAASTATAPAAAAGAEDQAGDNAECAKLADHITDIQFTRIKQMPDEQRQRYEQALPQIKQQITSDCAQRWPEDFKNCIAAANTEDAFTECVRKHAPRPPARRQPPPEKAPQPK